MIGALIGDLAARSWQNDRKLFYSHLIKSDVEPSIYGHTILKAASRNIISDPRIDVQPESSPNSIKYYGQWLMWQIVGAWIDTDILVDIPTFHSLDKGEYYAKMFVYQLIKDLRSGATKSEAFNKNYSFKSLMKGNHFNWKSIQINDDHADTILIYIFRAWDSFYRGFDFTSSIHNAMQWSGDKHLLGAITGAFAEAMYGCQFNLIKKKFQKEDTPLLPFELNDISERNGYHHGLIFEINRVCKNKRLFYSKNEALTNVEYHYWQRSCNAFENVCFTKEEHSHIMKSAPTNWDCRYGIYLDDGWHYVYRSKSIIARFKMEEEYGKWKIIEWQLSGEQNFKNSIIAFDCALYEGCRIINQRVGNICHYITNCKYFNGETKVPSKWEGTTSGKFWHGEMMFITSLSDFTTWEEMASSITKNLNGSKMNLFKEYTNEQKSMVCYIEALYSKWCPYDKLDWILEY